MYLEKLISYLFKDLVDKFCILDGEFRSDVLCLALFDASAELLYFKHVILRNIDRRIIDLSSGCYGICNSSFLVILDIGYNSAL